MNKVNEIKMGIWAGGSVFKYFGSIRNGTMIKFGKNYEQSVKVSEKDYRKLLNKFRGRKLNLGTTRTNPPGW